MNGSQTIDGGVRGDPVGECFDPVGGCGLADDDGRQPVVPVGQDCEAVAGGVRVDAHGEEVVDDEQVNAAELVEHALVADCVAAGDNELACEVVHADEVDGVLGVAGGNADGADHIGLASAGRGDDQHVPRVGLPVAGGVAFHSRGVDLASGRVAYLGDRGLRDGEP